VGEQAQIPLWKTACTALTLGIVYFLGPTKFVDLDIWHSMSVARDALRLGHIPLEDRFAFTPTVFPVVHHEWAWGFVLYFLGTHGGLVALEAARVVLYTVLAVLTVRVAVMRGADASSFIVSPSALVMSWIGLTALRAQVVTLVFLALLLGFIESDRRGRRSWIVPALLCHVVWLNVHAGFVVGMGVLALHAVEQAVRRRPYRHLIGVLVAMAALVLVNPYGTAYATYLLPALTMSRSLIIEWRPIWMGAGMAITAYLVSVAIAGAALVAVGPRNVPGWPLLLVTAYLAMRHQRHISIFAIVWLTQVPAMVARTTLGRTLTRAWARPANALSITTSVWSVFVALFFAAQLHPWELHPPGQQGAAIRYPVGTVDYLRDHAVEGRLINPFEAGAFISWKLDGRVKVSMDGRYEAAYRPGVLEEQMDFYDAKPGWEDLLARYAPDLVLLRPKSPVLPLFTTQDRWKLVYQDDQYVLFARPGLDLPPEDRRGIVPMGTFP